MGKITKNNVYDKISHDIVVQNRFSAVPALIREIFYDSQLENDSIFKDIEAYFDTELQKFEDAIKLGNYDYINTETGETEKGSFQQIPESETINKLIIPILSCLFSNYLVSTEDKVGDYKVDASVYPDSSATTDLNKSFKLEAKRIMHGMRSDGVVCLKKSQIEETFFKYNKTPGMQYREGSYRITGAGGKQVISNISKGKDTLSSEGICVFTNGMYFAVSVNYHDTFNNAELREFSKSIPILRENAKQNDGIVFTGAFDNTDYPLFVFPIKTYDCAYDEYSINREELSIFCNMLKCFMNHTKEWYEFLRRVHMWYIDELRGYIAKS